MPLSRIQKQKIISGIAEKLKAARIAVFTDYRGLTVPKIQGIKKSLKASGASFGVVKKTLLAIAAKTAGASLDELANMTEAVALTTSATEDMSVVKTIAKAAKENPELAIHGALFESRFLNKAEVIELAKIPSREELLAKLAGTLAAPMSGFARVLQGPLMGFATIINKLATR